MEVEIARKLLETNDARARETGSGFPTQACLCST